MDFFLTFQAPIVAFALILGSGVACLFLARVHPEREELAGVLAHLGALLGAAIMGFTAYQVLAAGQGLSFTLQSSLPFIEFAFRWDAFASYFVILTALVGIAVSLYGLSYQKHLLGRGKLGWYGLLFNAFLVSLFCLPLANHAFFFLLVWEMMSLVSYFLVIYEQDEASEQAGFQYFLMAHLGTAFITLALLLMYGATGSFHFDVWRLTAFTLDPWLQAAVYAAALIGFGAKAGIIPLHIWLPEAHPAAPSPVSALMSGVMVKAALFMLVRVFFDLVPGARMEWGLLIIALGSVSALLGILYALAEKDLKRLLAYSTVENMGIMFLGLGSAIVFFALGAQSFALFALAAALYHALNHALFKSLLFLGAGHVAAVTGTRQLDAYGGLIRVLPFTASLFLLGSLALAAFPPLNGFAGKWLTFQALFVGVSSPELLVKSVFVAAIAALALTSGLTAAASVKAFGGTFLARPRRPWVELPTDPEKPALVAMGFLGILIVVSGLGATVVIASLIAIIASFGFIQAGQLQFPFADLVAARNDFANVLPLDMIALLFLGVFGVIASGIWYLTRRRQVVLGNTWDCGMPLGPRTQVSATGLARSLVTIFQGVLRPSRQKSIEYQDGRMRYFIKRQAIATEITDVSRQGLYRPLHAVLLFVARQAKRIQQGSVNVYILYIFITLLALLFWADHTS